MSSFAEEPASNTPEGFTAIEQEMRLPQSEEQKSTSPSGGMLAPLKVRNFQLLFAGQTISTFGDTFYAVALPWLVLTSGESAQELGIILTTYGIPRLGTVLLGGILSDRLGPRTVMLLADAVRTVLVGILALLAILGHPTFWQFCTIALFLGASEGLFLPASSSMMPAILEDEHLQAGNGLNFSANQLASLLGSSMAGIVVSTLRAGFALAIDAATFLVSAISLLCMRNKKLTSVQTNRGEKSIAQTDTTEKGAIEQITLWQLLRTSQLMQGALVVVIVANLLFGGVIEVALPALAHGQLAAGATGYGIMLATFGAGALIGSLLAGMMGKWQHRALIALLISLIQGGAVMLLPYAGGLIGAIVCLGIMGLSNSISNILFMTIMQQYFPRHLLGRIMSVFMLASFGTYPLSVLLAGIVTNRFGPALLFPIGGLSLILAILYGLTQKEFRKL